MRIKVFKFFGREVLRIENHYEATVSDVVRAMIEAREAAANEEVEYVYECACGEEEEDEEEESDDDGIMGRFADMTERIVWDARTSEHPFPFPLGEPKDDDEES